MLPPATSSAQAGMPTLDESAASDGQHMTVPFILRQSRGFSPHLRHPTSMRRSRPPSFRLGISAIQPRQHRRALSLPLSTPRTDSLASTQHGLCNPNCSSHRRLHETQSTHSLAQLIVQRAEQRHQHAWCRRTSRRSLKPRVFICSVYGVLLITLLITYLALLLHLRLPLSTGAQAAFILAIVLFGVLFLHSILRLGMLSHGRRRTICLDHTIQQRRGRRRGPELDYTARYPPADALPDDDSIYSPVTPVRVHLVAEEKTPPLVSPPATARGPVIVEIPLERYQGDEEEELESPDSSVRADASIALPTAPPPAYGLWRCSVRADPNLLHWVQAGDAISEASSEGRPPPPSYISTPLGGVDAAGEPIAQRIQEQPSVIERAATTPTTQVSTTTPVLPPLFGASDAGIDRLASMREPEMREYPLRSVDDDLLHEGHLGGVQEVARALLRRSRVEDGAVIF